MPTVDEQMQLDTASAISEQQSVQDARLSVIVKALMQYINDALSANEKRISKVSKAIKQSVGKTHAKTADALDSIYTTIDHVLNGQIAGNEWTLTQIALTAGLIDVGDSVADIQPALAGPSPPAPEYVGQLVLQCSQLGDVLAPLITVLREIRDRMPYVPTVMPIESPTPEPYQDAAPVPELAGTLVSFKLPPVQDGSA